MALVSPRSFCTPQGDLVTIRTALPGDAAAILAYVRRRLQEDEFYVLLPEEFDKNEEQERQWLQEGVEAPGKLNLLAEAPCGLIGMLNFENGPRKRLAHRGSFGLSLAPPWRRLGVGAALLSELLAWGQRHPEIDKISLSVYAANHGAIALYQKLGFVEEGRRPKELKLGPGHYADEVLMYRFVSENLERIQN